MNEFNPFQVGSRVRIESKDGRAFTGEILFKGDDYFLLKKGIDYNQEQEADIEDVTLIVPFEEIKTIEGIKHWKT
jgi:hypothetical protein